MICSLGNRKLCHTLEITLLATMRIFENCGYDCTIGSGYKTSENEYCQGDKSLNDFNAI